MSQLLMAQGKDIFIMLYCGLTIEMLYELLGSYRRRKPCARRFLVLSELLFWLMAAFLASWFLYDCCYGMVTFHALSAMGAGMLLWRFCVGEKISTLIRNTCGIMKDSITGKWPIRRDEAYGKKEEKQSIQKKKSGH